MKRRDGNLERMAELTEMRTAACPICSDATRQVLELHFGKKMQLPTEISIRHCAHDNFLFVGNGKQADYDAYYAGVANDTYHREISGGAVQSPIAGRQFEKITAMVSDFFATPRHVLDFGCGEGSLLLEFASKFPASAFYGFEPGPAAKHAVSSAQSFGLRNLSICGLTECRARGPFDLVIASHVFEHVLDFGSLGVMQSLVKEGGLIYVEVPDAAGYPEYARREFLYYFDRLHVNHFTTKALGNLLRGLGFGYVTHTQYSIPYRDGGEYPVLGVLFRQGAASAEIEAANVFETSERYIHSEQARASETAKTLKSLDGVLIWGMGDNFYRSSENGGPLENLAEVMLLDRTPREVMYGGRAQKTMDPVEAVRKYAWPVVVTVSEARNQIGREIAAIDPERRIFYL